MCMEKCTDYSTTTYRLLADLFAVELFGLPGGPGGGVARLGGPEDPDEGGGGVPGGMIPGLGGGGPTSSGTKLERTRFRDRRGGEVRSIADAERVGPSMAGGGGPLRARGAELPGEAVWARDGGGGGVAGLAASAPPWEES